MYIFMKNGAIIARLSDNKTEIDFDFFIEVSNELTLEEQEEYALNKYNETQYNKVGNDEQL